MLDHMQIPKPIQYWMVGAIYGLMVFCILYGCGFEQGRFKYIEW